MPLDDVVTWLADAWSINADIAGTILSFVVILAVMLPIFLATHNSKNASTMWIVSFFMVQAILVGIGWLNVWITLACLLMASLAFADKIAAIGD